MTNTESRTIMVVLIALSLAAYVAIALLFKAAASHTRPDQYEQEPFNLFYELRLD